MPASVVRCQVVSRVLVRNRLKSSWLTAALVGGALTALFAGGEACAQALPCTLTENDWNALAHARKVLPSVGQITLSTAPKLTIDQQVDLCASRKFADDPSILSADALTDAYDARQVPQDFSFFVTESERQKYAAELPQLIEKTVGRDPALWKTFIYPELGFSVDAPFIEGVTDSGSNTEQPCGKIVFHFKVYRIMKVVLMAGEMDIPPVCSLELRHFAVEDFVQAAALGTGGKILSVTKITASGVEGREFDVQVGDLIVHARYFVDSSRMYAVLGSHMEQAKQLVQKFEDSFRLLPNT